jgi:hypothetical protein
MEPATGMSRLDGDGGALTQSHSDPAQLAEDLYEPLLRAATEILRAMAELPDERVDHDLELVGVGLGVSTELDLEALTEHLIAAIRALSAADAARQTWVASLPVGGVSS